MRKTVPTLAALGLLAGFTLDVSAQVYLCGDHYTNKPTQGESCILVPSGKITVVPPKVSSGESAATPDQCAPPLAKQGQGWQPPNEDSLTWRECRDLTDTSRNQGNPLTVRQLEQVRVEYARDPNYSPDTLWSVINRDTMQRKTDCMIASGDIKMCTCLASELPVALAFSISYLQYVLLITSPRSSDLSHLNWKPYELERLYVDVRSVRDMCVSRDRSTIASPRYRQKR